MGHGRKRERVDLSMAHPFWVTPTREDIGVMYQKRPFTGR